ncbi:hypothetical protein ACJX0J_015593, partial [Zea mays]
HILKCHKYTAYYWDLDVISARKNFVFHWEYSVEVAHVGPSIMLCTLKKDINNIAKRIYVVVNEYELNFRIVISFLNSSHQRIAAPHTLQEHILCHIGMFYDSIHKNIQILKILGAELPDLFNKYDDKFDSVRANMLGIWCLGLKREGLYVFEKIVSYWDMTDYNQLNDI